MTHPETSADEQAIPPELARILDLFSTLGREQTMAALVEEYQVHECMTPVAQAVFATPTDFVSHLIRKVGLSTRERGLNAMVARMKRHATEALAT